MNPEDLINAQEIGQTPEGATILLLPDGSQVEVAPSAMQGIQLMPSGGGRPVLSAPGVEAFGVGGSPGSVERARFMARAGAGQTAQPNMTQDPLTEMLSGATQAPASTTGLPIADAQIMSSPTGGVGAFDPTQPTGSTTPSAEDLLNLRVAIAQQASQGGGGGIPRGMLAVAGALQDRAGAAQQEFLNALGNRFDTEAGGLEQLGQQQAGVAEDLARLDEMRQHDELSRQNAARAELGRLQQMVGDLSQARINPERALGEGFSGTRITAAISSALGAMGQAFVGGGNPGMEYINGMIERDILAQQEAIRSGRVAFEASANLYQVMLNNFEDERAAELATKAAMLEQATMRTRSLMSATQADNVRANGVALIAQLKAAQAAAMAQFMQERLRRAGSGRRRNYNQLLSTLGDLATFHSEREKAQLEGHGMPPPGGWRFTDPEIGPRFWGGEGTAETRNLFMREVIVPTNQLIVSLQEAKDLADQGMELWSDTDRRRAEVLAQTIRRQYNVWLGQGAIAASQEGADLQAIFPDATEITVRRLFGGGGSSINYDQAIEIVRGGAASVGRAFYLEPEAQGQGSSLERRFGVRELGR